MVSAAALVTNPYLVIWVYSLNRAILGSYRRAEVGASPQVSHTVMVVL
jgi:hypothetical protein